MYDELESEIASWENTESALVFNSGYVANLGIITSLCNRDTEIFSDKLNHASIIDGIQLSGGIMTRYLHCNLADLEKKLAASTRKDKIIVTDTVFSMDGDCAPLADICELAAKYRCMVMVDEAHATGIFGKTGSGLVEQCGLEKSVDIRMGTLSKSIAGLGGYFAGSQMLRDYFVNTSRSLIYSTGLPHAAFWPMIWPRCDTFAFIRKWENNSLRNRQVSESACGNWGFQRSIQQRTSCRACSEMKKRHCRHRNFACETGSKCPRSVRQPSLHIRPACGFQCRPI